MFLSDLMCGDIDGWYKPNHAGNAPEEGSMGWAANFELSWRIGEYSIKDAPGITSNIWKNEAGDIFLNGFSLQIPPSSREEALIIALEKRLKYNR